MLYPQQSDRFSHLLPLMSLSIRTAEGRTMDLFSILRTRSLMISLELPPRYTEDLTTTSLLRKGWDRLETQYSEKTPFGQSDRRSTTRGIRPCSTRTSKRGRRCLASRRRFLALARRVSLAAARAASASSMSWSFLAVASSPPACSRSWPPPPLPSPALVLAASASASASARAAAVDRRLRSVGMVGLSFSRLLLLCYYYVATGSTWQL